jgi:GNAT superfamily N-acetyltransferase
MSDLTFDPALPTAGSECDRPFLQRIALLHGNDLLAHAAWHTTGHGGVAQLVDLFVAPEHRRQGHASRLLNAVVEQARLFFRSRAAQTLRRVWVAVEQKDQVIARSFLTRHGFHHIATIPDVSRNQDLLVYVKSFD